MSRVLVINEEDLYRVIDEVLKSLIRIVCSGLVCLVKLLFQENVVTIIPHVDSEIYEVEREVSCYE